MAAGDGAYGVVFLHGLGDQGASWRFLKQQVTPRMRRSALYSTTKEEEGRHDREKENEEDQERVKNDREQMVFLGDAALFIACFLFLMARKK